jgi:hypothetical protein
VPPVQVSDVVACGGCLSITVRPVRFAIISEVGIGSEVLVAVLSSTIFIFVFIVKDRHFDNLVYPGDGFTELQVCVSCDVSNALVLFLEVLTFLGVFLRLFFILFLFSEAVASTMSVAVTEFELHERFCI